MSTALNLKENGFLSVTIVVCPQQNEPHSLPKGNLIIFTKQTQLKNTGMNNRFQPVYLFWREKAGTVISIDSIELIDVVRHDILSQTIAPSEYFFRSRLNCRISSVIKTLPAQICDYEIIALTKLPY